MLRRFFRASKRKLTGRGSNKDGERSTGLNSNTSGNSRGGTSRRRKGRTTDHGTHGKGGRFSLDDHVDMENDRGRKTERFESRTGNKEEIDGGAMEERNRIAGAGGGGGRNRAARTMYSKMDHTQGQHRNPRKGMGNRDGNDNTATRITRNKNLSPTSATFTSRKKKYAKNTNSLSKTQPEPRLLREESAGAIDEDLGGKAIPTGSGGGGGDHVVNGADGEEPIIRTSPSSRKRSSSKSSGANSARRLSVDEAAFRGRRDSGRRISRGVSAELEGEAVRGMDVDPSRALQKGMPLGVVSEAEHFRRLSLDGDLPEEARRPDATPGKPEGEGIIHVGTDGQGGYGGGVQFGACSKAGWEPHRTGRGNMTSVEVRKENQDAYFVYAPFEQQSEVLLGVFDGHGSNGRTVAQFVRDTLPKAMKMERVKWSDYENQLNEAENGGVDKATRMPGVETNRMRVRALKAAFSRAERGLQGGEAAPCDHVFSGTTAVVAWIVDGLHMYTAWAGDSRCILGRKTTIMTRSANHGPDSMTRTKFKAVELSHDQKPMRTDEKKRVRQAGGRVARWRRNIGPLRVWLPRDWVPGLAMTRSIGDTVLSDFGVSPIPEVSYTKLTHLDSFVVLASDGVWEFMNSDEVADFVGRWRKEGKDPAEAAEALVREAVRRWRRQEVVVDDTTAVIVWLDGESTKVGRSEYGRDDPPSSRADAKRRPENSMTKKKIWPFGRDRREDRDKVVLLRDDGRFMPFNVRNDALVGQ